MLFLARYDVIYVMISAGSFAFSCFVYEKYIYAFTSVCVLVKALISLGHYADNLFLVCRLMKRECRECRLIQHS